MVRKISITVMQVGKKGKGNLNLAIFSPRKSFSESAWKHGTNPQRHICQTYNFSVLKDIWYYSQTQL